MIFQKGHDPHRKRKNVIRGGKGSFTRTGKREKYWCLLCVNEAANKKDGSRRKRKVALHLNGKVGSSERDALIREETNIFVIQEGGVVGAGKSL